MYDDYRVVYESKLNEYLILWIVLGIVALVFLVITLISISKILKKANRSPILGLIPIYNLLPLLEITNMEKKYFISLLIPIVNIPFLLMLNLNIAKSFKKNQGFGIGMLVFPFVFYPILAFGNSEYIGINLVAMDRNNTVSEISMIDDDKNVPIEKEINDQMDDATISSNISLGGGKYQKNYQNSLLEVEDNMIAKGEIQKPKPNKIVTDGKFFNSSLIKEQELLSTDENVITPTTNDLVSNVPNNPIQQPTNVVNSDLNKSATVTPVNNQEVQSVSTQSSNVSSEPVDLLKSNAQINNQSNQVTPGFCPNCGTRVPDNAKICMICGQKLI